MPCRSGSPTPLAALVFKTLGEQHVGDLNLLRVYAGSIKPGDEVYNPVRNSAERIGQIFRISGRERAERIQNVVAARHADRHRSHRPPTGAYGERTAGGATVHI